MSTMKDTQRFVRVTLTAEQRDWLAGAAYFWPDIIAALMEGDEFE